MIARVPLDEGGLTGKFDSITKFSDDDFRRRYFSPQRLKELETRINLIKKENIQEVSSMTELALRWILTHPEVSTTIPGMRISTYVKQNISFDELWDQVNKTFIRQGNKSPLKKEITNFIISAQPADKKNRKAIIFL